MTSFAGGFLLPTPISFILILPAPINFNDVFNPETASFAKNSTIYATIISMIVIFLLCSIWCGYRDCQDEKKTKIKTLERQETFSNPNYFYEMIFYTGKRPHSATDSSVKFRLYGDLGESDMIEIKQNKEFSNFRRGKKLHFYRIPVNH